MGVKSRQMLVTNQTNLQHAPANVCLPPKADISTPGQPDIGRGTKESPLLRPARAPPIYSSMTRFLPILPLRDIVVFPHRIVPLFVGREKSVAALEAAMAADKELFLVAQLDPGEDDPDRDAMYDLGVIATAMQLLKLPDGTVRVLVEGVKRARLVDLVSREDYAAAEIEEVEEEDSAGPEAQALMRSVIDQFENYAKLNKR